MRYTMRNCWQAWRRERARGVLLASLGILPLVLVACGSKSIPPGGLVVGTPGPTIPLPPAQALTWQARTFPATPFDTEPFPPGLPLGLAESDSSVAYECAGATNSATAAIYATHDAARTWSRVGTLSPGVAIYSCGLVVDERQPNTIVAQIFSGSYGFGNFNGTVHSYLSRDGGTTWSAFKGPEAVLSEFATVGTTTYALFRPIIEDLMPLQTTFVASTDGMRTWQATDQSITAGNGGDPTDIADRYVTQFWLNPVSGTLLALSATSETNTNKFFTSQNGGHSWQAIPTPGADQFYAQTPIGNIPWTICGVYDSMSSFNTAPPTDLICSYDGGQTWTHRGNPMGVPSPDNPIGFANDGSLLLGIGAIERLTPGLSPEQSLGPVPTPSSGTSWQFAYVPGAGHGRLWALPISSDISITASMPVETVAYQ